MFSRLILAIVFGFTFISLCGCKEKTSDDTVSEKGSICVVFDARYFDKEHSGKDVTLRSVGDMFPLTVVLPFEGNVNEALKEIQSEYVNKRYAIDDERVIWISKIKEMQVIVK